MSSVWQQRGVILKTHAQESVTADLKTVFFIFPAILTLWGDVVPITQFSAVIGPCLTIRLLIGPQDDDHPMTPSWSSPGHCYQGVTSHATHKQTWTWPSHDVLKLSFSGWQTRSGHTPQILETLMSTYSIKCGIERISSSSRRVCLIRSNTRLTEASIAELSAIIPITPQVRNNLCILYSAAVKSEVWKRRTSHWASATFKCACTRGSGVK